MRPPKIIVASLVLAFVALVWNGILHLVLLRSIDARVAHLFRPDVSFPLSLVLTLAITSLFVIGYGRFTRSGDMAEGAVYGFFFGVLAGVLVDFNQYVLYPIPFEVAALWFCGGVAEFTLYGVIVSKLLRARRDVRKHE